MRSRLKPREINRELSETLLRLLRSRGFSVRPLPASGLHRKDVKGDLDEVLGAFIRDSGIAKVEQLHVPAAQLSLGIPVAYHQPQLPLCDEVVNVRQARYPRPTSRRHKVSPDEVNSATVCFACFFVREGFRGEMRWAEALDPLRAIVVKALEGFGYSVEGESADQVQKKTIWPTVPNWRCLANKDGARSWQLAILDDLVAKSA